MVRYLQKFGERALIAAALAGVATLWMRPVVQAASPVEGDSQKIFQTACAGCHGPDGRGTSPAAKLLNVRDLLSPEVQKMSDAALFAYIAKGSKNMPPSEKTLGRQKIQALVSYLRAQARKK